MTYKIEENKIVFDEAPRSGDEVSVTVSTQQTLNGFSDPRSYYPRRVNEVDTNRLAVNDLAKQHPVVDFKKKRVDDLTGEPKTPYNAQYPFNHVRETESGHIKSLMIRQAMNGYMSIIVAEHSMKCIQTVLRLQRLLVRTMRLFIRTRRFVFVVT